MLMKPTLHFTRIFHYMLPFLLAMISWVARGQPALTNGLDQVGAIAIGGETNTWTLTANAGDTVLLRIGAPTFTPRLDLYGPNGGLIGSAFTADDRIHDARLAIQATNSGTFTVVASSYFFNGTGTYTLHLAHAPEAFVVSPGDEGGALINGA